MPLVAILFALALDPTAAQNELQRIRQTFALHDKAASIAELERFAASATGTESGAEANVWLGDLARQAHALDRAHKFYAAAYRSDGASHRFAARGLGDLEVTLRHFDAARALYNEAAVGANPVVAVELANKLTLLTRMENRARIANFAWLILAAILGWFAVRMRPFDRSVTWHLPIELVFVAPVFGLILLSALGRDRAVLAALIEISIGASVVIAAAGFAQDRARSRSPTRLPIRSPTRATISAALAIVVALAAVFYLAVYRAELIDTLFNTVASRQSL